MRVDSFFLIFAINQNDLPTTPKIAQKAQIRSNFAIQSLNSRTYACLNFPEGDLQTNEDPRLIDKLRNRNKKNAPNFSFQYPLLKNTHPLVMYDKMPLICRHILITLKGFTDYKDCTL